MSNLSEWIEFNPRVVLEKEKDYPFVGMERIQPGMRYVMHEEDRSYTGGGTRFCHGDTLFARITPCLENGKIAQFVAETEGCGFGSTEFFVLRAKAGISDPSFVYYLSQTDLLRNTAIKSMVGASGRQRADIESLRSLELELPVYAEQKEIGSTLSLYDDLIETNRRRIALLEEAARLLYREWFVNLRFPGHDQCKMVDGLPVGWSHKTVGEMTSFLSRGITPKYDDAAPGMVINQKCIRDGRLSLAFARKQSKEVNAVRLVRVGDVLINSTGAGTLGRVAQIRVPIPDCTVDTHVTIVRPLEPDSIGFFGVALLELESLFSTMGVGATNQTELGRADIGALLLVVPPPEIRNAFHDRVWTIFDQIETLSQANLRLAQVRDELLPKLMSGAIQV